MTVRILFTRPSEKKFNSVIDEVTKLLMQEDRFLLRPTVEISELLSRMLKLYVPHKCIECKTT
jgi:hypothetical protein